MATYRKVYIAVICEDDNELAEAQKIAQDLSGAFRLSAKNLIQAYPMIKKNGTLIANSMRTIAREGMSGIAKVIPQLMRMKK